MRSNFMRRDRPSRTGCSTPRPRPRSPAFTSGVALSRSSTFRRVICTTRAYLSNNFGCKGVEPGRRGIRGSNTRCPHAFAGEPMVARHACPGCGPTSLKRAQRRAAPEAGERSRHAPSGLRAHEETQSISSRSHRMTTSSRLRRYRSLLGQALFAVSVLPLKVT